MGGAPGRLVLSAQPPKLLTKRNWTKPRKTKASLPWICYLREFVANYRHPDLRRAWKGGSWRRSSPVSLEKLEMPGEFPEDTNDCEDTIHRAIFSGKRPWKSIVDHGYSWLTMDIPRNPRTPRNPRDPGAPRILRIPRNPRNSKNPKDPKNPKRPKNPKDPRNPRIPRIPRNPWIPRIPRNRR